MPENDGLEDRLRRTFQWIASSAENRADLPSQPPGTPSPPMLVGNGFSDGPGPLRPGRANRRPSVQVAALILLLAAVGIPVGLLASGPGPSKSGSHHSRPVNAPTPRDQVVSALGATTAAGNWDISYSYDEAPGSNTTTTTTSPETICGVQTQTSGASCVTPSGTGDSSENASVTGTGIIDVNPKAMVTDADTSNVGHVILRIDPTQVWELGSDDSGGLAPSPSDSSSAGEDLSQFAPLVEGTLGTREGAVAMLGIASPTGYLELDEQAITGVTPTGHGTVDGKAVSEYRVSAAPSELENDPSASSEEVATIRAAITTLESQGLSATSTDLAVDAQGFIVRSVTTYQFSDGGSVVVQAQFSNFGCAGDVLMPGQVGPTAPPANCVSSNSPQATTTTDPGSATTTTTTAPSAASTTSTTAPGSSTTTTSMSQ
jgi:hypothetical protein